MQTCLRLNIKKLLVLTPCIITGHSSNVHEWLQAMDLMLLPSLYEGVTQCSIEWQVRVYHPLFRQSDANEANRYSRILPLEGSYCLG